MATDTYFPKSHTADEWREMAAVRFNRAAESFDRCDTDGFLSQAASNTMGLLYNALAKLAEEDGRSEFIELADLDGNLLPARYVKTRYGYSWVYEDAAGITHWFHESKARKGEARRAAHEKKGYRLMEVTRDAVVHPDGWSHIIKPAKDSPVYAIREMEYSDY